MKRPLFAYVLACGVACGGGAPRSRVPEPRTSVASIPPPHFDGPGPHTLSVSTKSPEAQRYFDQGVAFMSAFNHDEAERSFAHAAQLDPSCAMAHWGVAMANGSHINNPEVDLPHAKAAWAALQRARAASSNGTKVERDLVEALAHAEFVRVISTPFECRRAPRCMARTQRRPKPQSNASDERIHRQGAEEVTLRPTFAAAARLRR